MWLQDLEKALAILREKRDNFNIMCVDRIIPIWGGGITFYTSNFTIIKVYSNGVIEEEKV